MNRTSLKKAAKDVEAQLVAKKNRRAHAIKQVLPVRAVFAELAHKAAVLRSGDLARKSRGQIENLFRERLLHENIPILMSPPIRPIAGILIGKRKPDGVYPDAAGEGAPAPVVYLEVKNVRRVSDDIQKRLYEIAEAALEMKLLYGTLKLEGLGIQSTKHVIKHLKGLRAYVRDQFSNSLPVVVALLLCPRSEAEQYREGAQAFVDRVFFQEEIDDCLEFLKGAATEATRERMLAQRKPAHLQELLEGDVADPNNTQTPVLRKKLVEDG